MPSIDWCLAAFSAFAWIGMFCFYFRDTLQKWIVNRFMPEKRSTPTAEESEAAKVPIFERTPQKN